jgi:hypothetical protein
VERELANDLVYHGAVQRIVSLTGSRPRRLARGDPIEAGEMLVRAFPARRVEVEVPKFILPATECVAVRCPCDRMAEI